MKKMECHHIRIRDTNDYNINVENFITSIEKQYKIDFRSLPQWKQLIKRLHVTTTDYKQKIQDSKVRKSLIIDKLYVQCYRPSPFELTDRLARTSGKWHIMETELKKRKVTLVPELIISSVSGFEEQSPDVSETAHQNTEIIASEDHVGAKLQLDVENNNMNICGSLESPHLPVSICTNQHKFISPLVSRDGTLSLKQIPSLSEIQSQSEENELSLLKQTLSIHCSPKDLIISDNSLHEQAIKFSITNCNTEYMHIRFKCVTEKYPFKRINILPVTPLRLYPGIAITFKFIFTLSQNEEEFISSLYFKVGRNVHGDAPTEALIIPIVSIFKTNRNVTISNTVFIPPIYIWQLKFSKPKSHVTICVNDNSKYSLHIVKREVDLTKEFDASTLSMKVNGPNSESLAQRLQDQDMESQSKVWSNFKGDYMQREEESITITDFIIFLVNEIVELSLESFLFEQTQLNLTPHSKRKIAVHFTKPQYIGKHQCYYDFEFCDPETNNIILTKTVKIFAEILAHPIQIHPTILDMSESPVTHGFCEDYFVITNTHRLYPATIKIKLTTKMKKLFQVTPMTTSIPAMSSVNFDMKFCSRDFKLVKKYDELAHFTIKIIVVGHKSVYYKAPPFFYEIIAPCVTEFKKIYSEKYYKQIKQKNQLEIDNLEQMS